MSKTTHFQNGLVESGTVFNLTCRLHVHINHPTSEKQHRMHNHLSIKDIYIHPQFPQDNTLECNEEEMHKCMLRFRREDGETVTGTDRDDNLNRQLFGYLPQRHESEHSNYYHIFMQITLLETCKCTAKHTECTFNDSQVFCIWNYSTCQCTGH